MNDFQFYDGVRDIYPCVSDDDYGSDVTLLQDAAPYQLLNNFNQFSYSLLESRP